MTDLAKVLAEFVARASRVKTTAAHVTTAERSNGDRRQRDSGQEERDRDAAGDHRVLAEARRPEED